MLPGRYQIVTGTLRGRSSQDGGLDLGEAQTLHLTAQEGNHLGAQDNIILDLLIAQIQEPVLQADFLLGIGGRIDFKGQILHDLAQNGQACGTQFHSTGGDLRVDSFGITPGDLTLDGDNSLLADTVEHAVLGNDYLYDAVLVPQIDKPDAAMVADVLHPAGHTDHFADIAFAHFAAGTGAILVFDNHESNLTFSSIYRQHSTYGSCPPVSDLIFRGMPSK